MSGTNPYLVPIQVLGLGPASLPVQLNDVVIVTQNGIPRECKVSDLFVTLLPVTTVALTAFFANLPTSLPAAPGQLWNNGGLLAYS